MSVVSIAWMKVAKNGKAYNVWDNHGGTDAFDKITGKELWRALPSELRSLERLFPAWRGFWPSCLWP